MSRVDLSPPFGIFSVVNMSSSEEDELCLLLLLRKSKRSRNNRSCSVRPLHTRRPSKGVYHTLLSNVKEDDKYILTLESLKKFV